ncbi:Aldo/keto reductase [Xylariaceae sp. FL0594]|nr:Aldo/keto reductase [Xylariaceae sp. FL0594]
MFPPSPPPAPSPARPPLHEVLPPLILGTATFNTQYVSDPFSLPASSIISRAFELGINAFDTSPYYGPSEIILGDALLQSTQSTTQKKRERSSYFLITKTGRIAGDEFDYTPQWIRYSVYRSLERLHTPYLDLVYAHDVEFVSDAEVLSAVRELRRLRDEEGVVKYVGISGYPVSRLCSLAEMVQRETGEPLDAVLSYAHFTLQNTRLGSADVMGRFRSAGVDVVLNASILGMGLLTTRGVDAGPMASWHPSPDGLRRACKELVSLAEAGAVERLEEVAIRWALDTWARVGAERGTSSGLIKGRVGVSVMGISNITELEETFRVFKSVMEGLDSDDDDDADAVVTRRQLSRDKSAKIQAVIDKMWDALGTWKDYSWESPGPEYVNTRRPEDVGVVPDDGVLARREEMLKAAPI